jgi:glycerol-1-phosphate dehydrogenase [NAD(P)+]
MTTLIRERLTGVNFPKVGFVMDSDEYLSEMRRVYKSVSDGCIALQKKLGAYAKDRLPIYLKHEQEIKEILNDTPTANEILGIITDIGLDINDFYSVYSKEKINDAVRYAKELKDRYTVLWLYYDLYGTEEILG